MADVDWNALIRPSCAASRRSSRISQAFNSFMRSCKSGINAAGGFKAMAAQIAARIAAGSAGLGSTRLADRAAASCRLRTVEVDEAASLSSNSPAGLTIKALVVSTLPPRLPFARRCARTAAASRDFSHQPCSRAACQCDG